MTIKHKTKPMAKPSQPVFRSPTSKEVEAIAHASDRISKRRERVQVTVEVAEGVCRLGQPHSDGPGCFTQVTDAFGTTSEDFANLLFSQAMNALSVPESSQQQTMNGVLAAVDGARPKDEIEAMLVSQMAVTHCVAMEYLERAKRADFVPQLESIGGLAVKLLRTYTAQVEALAKLRRGGEQTVRVEHVHVHSGGQAIVGNVAHGGGAPVKSKDQPHALGYAPGTPMPCADTPGNAVPVARNEERPLPDARWPVAGGSERE
jgi:hypothetical protein